MPYHVKKVKGGYKVKDSKGKTYSKKPLPKTRAMKQKKALQIRTKK